MLGFTEQPTWWEDQYGTDYSSLNTALWSDLGDGIIRQGARENLTNNAYLVNNPYRRVGLHEVIPVDESGNLIPPYNIISTGTTTKVSEWRNATVDSTLGYKTTSILVNDGINVSYDSSNVYLEGRALVNHTITVEENFVGHTGIEEQDISYAWPRTPTSVVSKTDLPDYAIGVLINGLPLYNTATIDTWNNEGEWN